MVRDRDASLSRVAVAQLVPPNVLAKWRALGWATLLHCAGALVFCLWGVGRAVDADAEVRRPSISI